MTFLSRLTTPLAARYFQWTENRRIFVPILPGQEAIKKPQEYPELRPYDVTAGKLTASDGVPITIWEKKAEPGKPHYLLFHGNTSHWGDTISSNVPHNARLDFLSRILNTGAGFTAVSLRGFGDSGGQPSEEGFARDIKAVVDHVLDMQKIPSRNIIVAGESLGSATATMAAQEMTRRGKPPAILGLVNPFFNMALEVTDVFKTDKWAKLLHAMPDYRQINDVLKNRFDTAERLLKLSRRTHLFIGTSANDEYIHPVHSDLLSEQMLNKGYVVDHFHFPGAGHSTWPRDTVVEKLSWHYDLMQGRAPAARPRAPEREMSFALAK